MSLSRALELLQALSGVVGGTLLETVRPAVDFDSLIDAGLVHACGFGGNAHDRSTVRIALNRAFCSSVSRS